MPLEPMEEGARVEVALADDDTWRTGTVIETYGSRVQLDDGTVVDEKTIVGWVPVRTSDEH